MTSEELNLSFAKQSLNAHGIFYRTTYLPILIYSLLLTFTKPPVWVNLLGCSFNINFMTVWIFLVGTYLALLLLCKTHCVHLLIYYLVDMTAHEPRSPRCEMTWCGQSGCCVLEAAGPSHTNTSVLWITHKISFIISRGSILMGWYAGDIEFRLM